MPRFAHDQNRARVYLSAAASSAAARVETAEKTAEKKSLEAVGLEPQGRSCSRRVRSAESGVEGKSLCEHLVWVWRERPPGKKIRSIRKLFCPSIQKFGKANILRQAPKREPAELYCETVWIAFFRPSVPS